MGGLVLEQTIDTKAANRGCCVPDLVNRMATETAETWAGIFKALGHPVRMQILDILSRYAGQVCVCDVETQFELSQPTISHHLKVLRQAGLLITEQRGQWIYYRVQPQTMSNVQEFLAGLA